MKKARPAKKGKTGSAVVGPPVSAFGKQFGANLKAEREKRGLSQEDLARKARLHRCRIESVEAGTRNIDITNMVRLADALGMELLDLCRGIR